LNPSLPRRWFVEVAEARRAPPQRKITLSGEVHAFRESTLFAKVSGYGTDDERPVFVFGMPRSGTTLVEQILASHPQVFGVGERRFAIQSLVRLAGDLGPPEEPLECLDRLTPEAVHRAASWHLEQLCRLDGGRTARVVDKMPENYMLLGWLVPPPETLLPSGRYLGSRFP